MNDTTANGKPPVYNSSTTAPDQRGVQVPDDRELVAPGTRARITRRIKRARRVVARLPADPAGCGAKVIALLAALDDIDALVEDED